jgi:hypothetical protein
MQNRAENLMAGCDFLKYHHHEINQIQKKPYSATGAADDAIARRFSEIEAE